MIRTTRFWRPSTSSTLSPNPLLPPPFRSLLLRRRTATKADTQHPVSQTSPQTSKTIPGPSWLWLEPIYTPFRAYGRAQRRRPYVTQFFSSITVYLVGDFVAQSISKPDSDSTSTLTTSHNGITSDEDSESKGWLVDWAQDRDWYRTARALFIGGAAAVPGYKWFLWLSNSFNYSSKILSLTTKVSVNQLLFTPLFNTYFFTMQFFLTSPSTFTWHDLVERLKHTVPTSWINSCKLWPAVTAFSFSFIPIEYRSIFGGVIAIGWQTYLSLLNARAEGLEELEEMETGSRHEGMRFAVGCDDDGREDGKCVA